MSIQQSPTGLIILDGFGYSSHVIGNAINAAHMPMWKTLCSRYPWYLLHASGSHVGLLPNQQGNSEVGHLTIGAGRVIPSTLLRIQELIDSDAFFTHQAVQTTMQFLHNNNKQSLHLIGLISDGNVHSSLPLLHAWLKVAAQYGITNIYIHAITDGRDTEPGSAKQYLQELSYALSSTGGKIASLHGRWYAMDRDANWERSAISYSVLTGNSHHRYASWEQAINDAYQQSVSDEFIQPCIIDSNGAIKPGDCVAIFNTRPDRMRQLMQYLIGFRTTHINVPLTYCITPVFFAPAFAHTNNLVLLPELTTTDTLLDTLAQHTIPIVVAAESEKQAHVTYFLQGQRTAQLPHYQACIIPSRKATTYVTHPEMSADTITQLIKTRFEENSNAFFVLNYANADMVGHSGNFNATTDACNHLDIQLAALYKLFVQQNNGTLYITSDHGNAESKINANGSPHTGHTTNPVPFVIVNNTLPIAPGLQNLITNRGLAAIAPTILHRLGLPIPTEMEQPLF